MKNPFLLALLALVLCFTTTDSFAVVRATAPIPVQDHLADQESEIHTLLDHASLEQQLGRKLKIKEKIALKFLRKKTKKTAPASGGQAMEDVKMDPFALTSFICGVVGLFLFGYILGTLAIVFGGIALSRIKKNSEFRKGKGLAITGLILGILGIILVTIFLATIF